MGKILTFFNHKGGVGKTTLVHNLAQALSDEGKSVLIIDADAQMNITASIYGLSTSVDYSTDVNSIWSANTKKYLSITEYLGSKIKNEPLPRKTLYRKEGTKITLLIGSIALSLLEFSIFGIVTNKNELTQSIPSKLQQAIDELAKDYDFILIDTSPSSSSVLNALFVLTSHYFIAPVSPTFFSLQAVDNLSEIFRNWLELLAPFQTTRGFNGIDIRVKFLGLVVQMAKRYKGGGGPNSQFTEKTESWVKDLKQSVESFVTYMKNTDRVISQDEFVRIFDKENLPEASPYIIEKCCDFTPKLRTAAEQEGVPVISLTPEQTKKHKCSISTERGQYKRSFDSITLSYRGIAKSLLNL